MDGYVWVWREERGIVVLKGVEEVWWDLGECGDRV